MHQYYCISLIYYVLLHVTSITEFKTNEQKLFGMIDNSHYIH